MKASHSIEDIAFRFGSQFWPDQQFSKEFSHSSEVFNFKFGSRFWLVNYFSNQSTTISSQKYNSLSHPLITSQPNMQHYSTNIIYVITTARNFLHIYVNLQIKHNYTPERNHQNTALFIKKNTLRHLPTYQVKWVQDVFWRCHKL